MIEAPENIRVLLADDHTIVREGLRALIDAQPDLEVVGEVADGRGAVDETIRLAPDVVVMDLAMPVLNGVDAARQIGQLAPKTRVLALSMHGGREYVRPAFRAGVSGYLLKGAGLGELARAIRQVARGEVVVDPAIGRYVVEALREPEGEDVDAETGLTARQREILQLVAEGRSSREIAQTLHLSEKTIEGHRGRIMERLGIRDLAGLVRYAVRIGLVSVDR